MKVTTPQNTQHGTVLIEVLVAMAILAIVLNQMYMQNAWPEVGARSTPCPQGNLPLQCEQKVSNSANPNFKRIDITVYMDDGAASENRTKLAWLTALLPNIRGGNF